MNIQIGKTKPIEYENTRIDKTRKPKTILSLADRLLLKLLLNNTSRMTGDCHVWFCERLRGETPLDLLGAIKNVSVMYNSIFQRSHER